MLSSWYARFRRINDWTLTDICHTQCLSSYALDSKLTLPCRRTDYNLQEVYSYGDKVGVPFIDHQNLDLGRLLDIRHFWQRHVLNSVELSFQESFAELPEDVKPKMLKEIPTEASKLSPSWLGYYCEYANRIQIARYPKLT